MRNPSYAFCYWSKSPSTCIIYGHLISFLGGFNSLHYKGDNENGMRVFFHYLIHFVMLFMLYVYNIFFGNQVASEEHFCITLLNDQTLFQ